MTPTSRSMNHLILKIKVTCCNPIKDVNTICLQTFGFVSFVLWSVFDCVMVSVRQSWYMLYDGRSIMRTAAVVHMVWRSPKVD